MEKIAGELALKHTAVRFIFHDNVLLLHFVVFTPIASGDEDAQSLPMAKAIK